MIRACGVPPRARRREARLRPLPLKAVTYRTAALPSSSPQSLSPTGPALQSLARPDATGQGYIVYYLHESINCDSRQLHVKGRARRTGFSVRIQMPGTPCRVIRVNRNASQRGARTSAPHSPQHQTPFQSLRVHQTEQGAGMRRHTGPFIEGQAHPARKARSIKHVRLDTPVHVLLRKLVHSRRGMSRRRRQSRGRTDS